MYIKASNVHTEESEAPKPPSDYRTVWFVIKEGGVVSGLFLCLIANKL